LTTVLNEQHCSFNRLSNRVVQPVWQPAVDTIQPFVKPVVKRVDNGFDNRLYRVNGALKLDAVPSDGHSPTATARSPRELRVALNLAETITKDHSKCYMSEIGRMTSY